MIFLKEPIRGRTTLKHMAINDHIGNQDDMHVRLKAAQQECQRLREENDRLRAMLGIDHSFPQPNCFPSHPFRRAFTQRHERSLHSRTKDHTFSEPLSRTRRYFRHSVGREGGQTWLFAGRRHGLAGHPCSETRRSKESWT